MKDFIIIQENNIKEAIKSLGYNEHPRLVFP